MKKIIIKYITIDIIIIILLSIFLKIKNADIINYYNVIKNIGLITIILSFYILFSIYKVRKNILDFNIVFILFILLFHFGQIILFSIGIDKRELSIFKLCSSYEIYEASIFFLYSIVLYHISLLFCLRKKSINNDILNIKLDTKYIKSIKKVAILFFIISIIPFNYILLSKFYYSMKFGYSYLYSSNLEYSTIMTYLSYYFVPSILLLFYSTKNRTTRIILSIYLFITAILNMLIGARGAAFTTIVIFIVFYYTFIKKINKKYFIKVLFIGLIISFLIPIIASFRSAKVKDISTLNVVIQESIQKNNFIVDTVSELGYSMHPFILTKKIIPFSKNFAYGESYIASIMMVIPKFVLGGYSFASKAALDIWLQDTLKMNYGPGYSLFAETYYNFGLYGGALFSLILGYFFTYFLSLSSKNKNKNVLISLLSLIFLYNSLILARYPFHNTIRNLVYLVLIPYLLTNIIYSNHKGSDRNE